MTAGLNTRQISGVVGWWTSSPSPESLCQWEMLTLIDEGAEMGPVWRVVFITGLVIVPQVEKSVRSTSRYTPRATNERKVALCFMLGLQQQQDVQVFFLFL